MSIEILGILIGYTIIVTFINLIVAVEGDTGWQWINPVIIYQNVPVNWFGCIILTILAHIAAGPIWVSLYWFYKLCTVGRKWED